MWRLSLSALCASQGVGLPGTELVGSQCRHQRCRQGPGIREKHAQRNDVGRGMGQGRSWAACCTMPLVLPPADMPPRQVPRFIAWRCGRADAPITSFPLVCSCASNVLAGCGVSSKSTARRDVCLLKQTVKAPPMSSDFRRSTFEGWCAAGRAMPIHLARIHRLPSIPSLKPKRSQD